MRQRCPIPTHRADVLKLCLHKTRAHTLTLGHFLQTNPIGYDDGMNFHAYADNGPINRIDPLGPEREPQPRIPNDPALRMDSGEAGGVEQVQEPPPGLGAAPSPLHLA